MRYSVPDAFSNVMKLLISLQDSVEIVSIIIVSLFTDVGHS